MRPHVADTARLLHDGLRARQAHPVRGGPGQPARRGPRHLSLRHQLEQFDGRRLERLRRAGRGSSTRIIGVIKAYATRVGRGPFPTELNDGPTASASASARTGREYGTVTGRPRRCGWFDAVAARYTADARRRRRTGRHAARRAERAGRGAHLHALTRWTASGIDYFPSDAFLLERCKPVYETLPGWRKDVTGARQAGRPAGGGPAYVDRLSELLGVPVSMISVGPDREQTILC